MKPWQRSLLYVFAAYVGLVVMLLLLENKLLYHPVTHAQGWTDPPKNEKIDDVDLTSADGTHIHAWWAPAKADSQYALLYCHGNAGNLSWRGNSIVKLRDKLDVSVLIIDYPGYGKSDGSPSEHGCYAAADAGYDWLVEAKKYPPKKIFLYGGSLGGGVITDVASRKEHRALILVKSFTSAPGAARSLYWWLPVPINAMMTNRYESIEKIQKCRSPIFIAHGTADEVIPYEHGERLFARANEPKRFFSMPGNGHNMALPDGFFDSLRDFLKENPVE